MNINASYKDNKHTHNSATWRQGLQSHPRHSLHLPASAGVALWHPFITPTTLTASSSLSLCRRCSVASFNYTHDTHCIFQPQPLQTLLCGILSLHPRHSLHLPASASADAALWHPSITPTTLTASSSLSLCRRCSVASFN